MIRFLLVAALALGLSACAVTLPPHPEARPFTAAPTATAAVDAALARAAVSNKRALLIFGYDACHDSRGLAGWFATPRFAAMLQSRYEIVWIDVGTDRTLNADLAARFGVAPIVGTPTAVIAEPDGTVLNAADAPGWRNAASRSEEEIYGYFERWGG
ncbi:MAG: thioredoxin family protein [Sphingopyxis sp.]|uniref:thioredoxin family protein n=1 Tax=Sphingopyxis sp. TaxID=1908224 RepID=UPI002ABCD62C|nr:thioredoxin family protein [Sphingopyxis sp.]MDZ3833737.1 thioredoxin family protein [Sphingopyxis sp.]